MDSAVNDNAPVKPAQWSAAAQRRLRLAQLLGLAMTLCGAGVFLAGTNVRAQEANLLITSGPTLLIAGLALIVMAARTRSMPPDRLYQPRSIVTPRMLFILVWVAGFSLSFFLLAADTSTTARQMLTLLLSITLMISGALWCFRWLSNKLRKQWPQQLDPTSEFLLQHPTLAKVTTSPPLQQPDPSSEFLLQWMPAWTVPWAGLWGVISTVPAFVVEGALTLLVAALFRPTLTGVARSTLSPLEMVRRLLDNPVLIVLSAIGAVIVAPMIEEAIKTFGLRLMRGSIRRPLDGWLLGFAIGLGFGVLEGTFYLADLGNWLLGGWLRLGALLLHGFATAIVGLAYARSLQTGRRRDLVGGYARGVTLHGVWNASALGVTGIAIGFVRPNAFVVCAGLLCFVMLFVLMVYVLPRIARAGTQSSVQETYRQASQSLPMSWSPMRYNIGWRWMGSRPEYATPSPQPAVTPMQPIDSVP